MDRMMAARVFVEVVDRGSQIAAADALDLSRAMVSRYLAELEGWLGARLLHRTTRRLSLTPAGEAVLPRCRQMLEIGDDMLASVSEPDAVPRGLLRVTCSTAFAQQHLCQVLVAFTERYPETRVELLVVDRTVNLIEERVDLAVRITGELDPNLIARRFTACRSVLYASPAYLQKHGTPKQPADLKHHRCLTYTYFGQTMWTFVGDDGPYTVPVSGGLSANESGVLLQAALAGAGITMQPTFAVDAQLRDGSLVPVLTEFPLPEMSIYGVYASRKHQSLALRVLLDFLAERFGTAYWEG
ncbi:LysR family transcriptional regulator [Burkholderiaceae bacterium DAT-1]|nr:LysR family transcriptional regulator [Burkholderiaceae bacterium DAT-1]